MNTDYSIHALEILLDEACLGERYYPLIPYKNALIAGLQAFRCQTKNDAAALTDADLAAIGLTDPGCIALFRRFLTLYDPNPQKFREIKKVTADPELQQAYTELYHLPGVKQTRASLYYQAGYRSLADFVDTTAEEVQFRTAQAISEYSLPYIVPLPKEIRTHIAVAKAFLWEHQMPKVNQDE